MSSTCLLFFGLFLFAATNGLQHKDILHRNRRSLANLKSMWTDLTGTDGVSKFLNYGNWCGLGGSGMPVDSIDGCCQSHDMCYNEIENSVCKNEGSKALYGKNYHYKIENEKATCDNENDDMCATALCICDAVLDNCIKSNLKAYNVEYYHPISIYDALMEGDIINNLKR